MRVGGNWCGGGGKMCVGRAQSKDRYGGQIPKKVLFGAFCQRRPAHGVKKRFSRIVLPGTCVSGVWTMSTCIPCSPGV